MNPSELLIIFVNKVLITQTCVFDIFEQEQSNCHSETRQHHPVLVWQRNPARALALLLMLQYLGAKGSSVHNMKDMTICKCSDELVDCIKM